MSSILILSLLPAVCLAYPLVAYQGRYGDYYIQNDDLGTRTFQIRGMNNYGPSAGGYGSPYASSYNVDSRYRNQDLNYRNPNQHYRNQQIIGANPGEYYRGPGNGLPLYGTEDARDGYQRRGPLSSGYGQPYGLSTGFIDRSYDIGNRLRPAIADVQRYDRYDPMITSQYGGIGGGYPYKKQ